MKKNIHAISEQQNNNKFWYKLSFRKEDDKIIIFQIDCE